MVKYSTRRAADVALPTIDLDIEATVRHAVPYVLRRGHRRVALLNVASTAVGASSFHEAFLEACAASGCAGVQGVVEKVALRPDSIEAAVRRLFARDPRPTAVITNNCELAIGLFTTLGLLGLRIPREVSVVICGHWPALEYLRPPVTAYRVSWETIANRIARIIHGQLHLGTRTERFWKVVPVLQEGGSVARVAAAAVTTRG